MVHMHKSLFPLGFIVFVLLAGTMYYAFYYRPAHSCVMYYSQDGKQLLYKGCK